MGTPLVEEAKVGLKPLPEISNAVVGVQIDMLVLHRAPEPFNKDVIHPSTLAVHADRNVVRLQDAGELFTGELTPLVGVEDLGPAVVCNGLFERLSTKVCGHGVRQPPRQNFARGPVHHGYKIGKDLGHGDVGDVGTPDVVRSCNGTVAKQVGVHLVLKVRNRRSRLLVNRRNAHLAHQALHPASGDGNALTVQLIPKAARPHVGMIHMQLVDPAHQVELFSRRGRGQPIDTRPRQAQKLALGNHTQRSRP